MRKNMLISVIVIVLIQSCIVFPIGNIKATEIDIDLYPTDDAYVDWMEPDTNYGSNSYLYAQSRTAGGPKVSYVKYDLSEIPEGSTINNAYFNVYISGRTGLHYLFLGHVGNTWDEDTLTWNNNPGLEYDIGWVYVSNTYEWYSWDVTSIVQNAIGGSVSFDMILEDGSGTITMYSKEMGYNKPTLEINYIAAENQPPYIPSNPIPANGSVGIPITVNLIWNGGDPDVGDTVTYDVYFGTTNPPPQVEWNQTEIFYVPDALNYATTYYWCIIAWDNHGASIASPLWSFTTADDGGGPGGPINFGVGLYYNDQSGRAVGFVEAGNYGLPDHYILEVKDLDTGERLSEFSKTGAVSNWIQITNISSSPIQYYPNSMDMYALFGNPNWEGTWLGLGVMSSPWDIKYISNSPITRDNFIVRTKPWTGYSAGGSQSRGMYFDYVDMEHTYLVRIIGDRNYIVEDLSTSTVLASGSFSGDNNNPNMDIYLEVSDITDTTMHVKTYTTISPPPYERLFFEGDLPRQAPSVSGIYKAGVIGTGANSDNYNPVVIRNVGGNLITILDYNETQTLYSISHPSSPADWEIIKDITSGTIDYNHPDGIYINGIQDEEYLALYPSVISEEDYTVIINGRFDRDIQYSVAEIGIIFNYEDEDNYYNAHLTTCPNPYFKVWKYEDGVRFDGSDYYHIPLVAGVTYDLKIKVSNSQAELQVYINNGIWNYTIDLSEQPPTPITVYVDDDYNESTPGWGYDHFSSIQAGIDAVDVGGIVYVASGTYNPPLQLPEYAYVYINKSMDLIGENRETTIINCPNPDAGIKVGWHGYVPLVENVKISGFTVNGGHIHDTIGIYIEPPSNKIIVENCSVNGFGDGIELWDATNCLVHNCIFYDNTREGGIDIPGGSNHTITGCTSYNNSHGIDIGGSNSCILYHNNLFNNTVNAYETTSSNIIWYNATLQEGNYYDDYTGEDTNGDGIGDIPYNISGGTNQDLYPLINPRTSPPTFVWVDDNYTGSTPGWGHDHFDSIQAGINAVDIGGTVFVYSGTYTEELGINPDLLDYVYIPKSLNLIGENKQTTIINCPSTETGGVVGIRIHDGLSNVNISGLTVKGINTDGSIGIYPQIGCNNLKIQDCITYNFCEGIGVRHDCYNLIIRNCTAYNNNRDGGIALREGGTNNFEISGCTSYSNTRGIFLAPTVNNGVIFHNNLYDNTINGYDLSTNSWYEPTLHEGNYYDDYTGVDNNHDGIGDTPYDIPGGSNQDLYPLMYPWGSVPESTIMVMPESRSVFPNTNSTFSIVIDHLPDGLSGYNLTISISNSSIATIQSVSFPPWAIMHNSSDVPSNTVWIRAIDLDDQITQHATNTTIASVVIRTQNPGTTFIDLSITRLDDDSGYSILAETQSSTLTVFDLPLLPGQQNYPTDPDEDGVFEDLNGNGLVDFDDVVQFFQYFDWMESNYPVEIIDVNGNQLIDYDDIVELFKEV